jgi:hypothetical protein
VIPSLSCIFILSPFHPFVKYLLFPFLVSNFRRIVNVVFFLLGDSLASESYMPTFRNTMLHLLHTAYEDGTGCSETSAYTIQAPGNHPKERIQLMFSFWLILKSCSFFKCWVTENTTVSKV